MNLPRWSWFRTGPLGFLARDCGCGGSGSGESGVRCSLRFRWAVGGLLLWLAVSARGAETAPAPVNLALHQPVESSGPNWGSFKPGALTDGDPATFTHPAAANGTLGFQYEVDLGATRSLRRIVLRNRADGCCPERLSRFRVEVWSEGSDGVGELRWKARMRVDGSHSGVGGVDEVIPEMDPEGDFSGRYVRVVNESGAAYNPQLAEIEVYGGVAPVIRVFAAIEDALRSGEVTTLRWEIEGATGAWLTPGPGPVPPGGGALFVSPLATTTYVLVATNAHGAVQASVTVGVDEPLDPPELTEFVADNAASLRDADGDSSDWIELWNPNRFALSVGGYGLSVDPRRESVWIMPEVRIPPRGYLVVFASGKNRTDPSRELHTDFRLRAAGENLALLDRDRRTVLRSYPAETGTTPGNYPAQAEDTGYGLGGDGRVGYLRPSTPGAANGEAYLGLVADTKFGIDRGYHERELLVGITCATPGATIRYTMDRTLPEAAVGQVYSGPVRITRSTVLRAAAFKEGYAPSDVDTQTYLFETNVLASSVLRRVITTNAVYRDRLAPALRALPSVSLVSASTINDSTEVAASLEWLPSAGEPGGARQVDCGVRLFGGAFTDFAKKSFRLYFRGKYGARRFAAPLFVGFDRGWEAVEEFDQLELRSGSHDMAMRGFYLSNLFTDDTQLELGQLAPHGRWVHLFLNGTYWGVYHLRERWGGAMHRAYLGGPDDGYESINGNWNVGGWAEPGTPYDGSGAVWARLKSLRRDYAAARAWLDVPQFVDYMILWMFGGAEDEYRCVGPVVAGSGFKFLLNDADGWLCVPQYCAAGTRTARGSPGRLPGDGPGSLFSMLYAGADPDYRVLLADRIHRAMFGAGALTPERNAERLDRRCAELGDAFLLESARWGYLSPAEWNARRDYVSRSWLPGRTAAVLAGFRGAGFYPSLAAPTLADPGGRVTRGHAVRLSGPAGATVWYTVDGSDPRLPGGAIASSAIAQAAGVEAASGLVVDRNLVIKARAKLGSQWSALVEAFYQVEASALGVGEVLVREMHFQPPGAEGAEFIELENVAGQAVNLRGARFTDGVRFAFPGNRDVLLGPGQRVVLTSDLYRFRQAHGIDAPVAGVFRGGLAREGETLVLSDAAGVVVTRLRFGGGPGWPLPDDSAEVSWVLADAGLGWERPFAWRLGRVRVGTPGWDDRVRFEGDAGRDQDADGCPAIVEYALGGSDEDARRGCESFEVGFDAEGWLTLTLRRQLGAEDVRGWVEASEDLRAWESADYRGSRWLAEGVALETWGVPPAGRGQVFLRYRVERR